MNAAHQLLTDQLDIWTAAEAAKKSGRGRGSGNGSNGISVYGVKKLRELILQLAVMGKLVPQDPNDEPASELLKRIQAEKARLMAEGKIKKGKSLPPITEEEKPYALPKGWKWVRLDELGVAQTGTTPPSKDRENFGCHIPFIGPGDIKNGEINYSGEGLSEIGLSKGRLIRKDSLLMVCIGGSIGKHAVNNRDVTCNQQINTLSLYHPVPVKYVYWAMGAISFQGVVIEQSGGSATPIINKQKWSSIPIPLPTLAEQHRIVAKVDELMALCDQLETQHINAAEAHEKLVNHLLGTLTQAQNADDFSANWQRIAAHFDTLFTTESSIDALKQTLLQLAVMGKLVPQDPNDEPASELLKRIQAEKARLIAEGKIKKGKPLPPISDEEKPFELPLGWEWVKMADICRPITSGSTPSAESFQYDDGIPFLKVYNIRNQEIDFDYKRQFISENLHKTKLGRSIIYPGDVVMNIVGPPLGKVAIIPVSYPEWNCNQAIVFFGLIAPMNTYYVLNFLKESSFLSDIDLIGTAGQDNISVTKSKNIPVPIPPLKEQHRIVAKVDELMALCDQLKTRITEASQLQQKLADAVVEQAVA